MTSRERVDECVDWLAEPVLTHLATIIPKTGDLEAEEHVPNKSIERMIAHAGPRGAVFFY